ncbi:DUF636 domain protein [Boeremia exigua]|uniref:DUF636 domain protein n=1 Tax=Boeremia exigua TaxID=749465 RepID=UPI001E8EC7D1|nr:DUF636 domain protein [Boeremia exigua]KAH6638469.1 DUF636 domain protein [Boeremia exigua]
MTNTLLEGSCCCGAIHIRSTGEIQAKALCHCLDCRKITGSAFSTNFIVPNEGFSVTKGSPKSFSKKAESGNFITSNFCGDCGSTLWRQSETFGDTKIIKVGTIDGTAIEDIKPTSELFIANRISWVSPVEGAEQNQNQ